MDMPKPRLRAALAALVLASGGLGPAFALGGEAYLECARRCVGDAAFCKQLLINNAYSLCKLPMDNARRQYICQLFCKQK